MAYQLVYTSAPKLIQAGRTGFGTVARHPALKGTLQEEIERISQFSRVAGLDVTRSIYAHRILNVRGEAFHVISRIKDAGSDYTGRTNHIAHHIVIPAAETKNAPSPVDVTAHLEQAGFWKDTWSEPPKEFTDADLINISDIPRSISLPATHWNPARYAALPASAKYAESCWLIHNGEISANGIPEILWKIGESLLVSPSPWQISFSSDIQPTERVEELRWRGVSRGSPMKAVALQSVRPTIDLTLSVAKLEDPEPRLAHVAEHGHTIQSSPVAGFKSFGHFDTDEFTEPSSKKEPLIRSGGAGKLMQGGTLKFDRHPRHSEASQSRISRKIMLIAGGSLAALIVIAFCIARSFHTSDHLNELETAISWDTPAIRDAVERTKSDWVYVGGMPKQLKNAVSALSAYADGNDLWRAQNYDGAMSSYNKGISAVADGLLKNALGRFLNNKKDELSVVSAVEFLNKNTIEAALTARNGEDDAISKILTWKGDHNGTVPTLNQDQLNALEAVKQIADAEKAYSQNEDFRPFKEKISEANPTLKTQDTLVSRLQAWKDDQVVDALAGSFKTSPLDLEVLKKILDAELLSNSQKIEAIKTLEANLEKLKNGIKADPQAITSSLSVLNIKPEDCPAIAAQIKTLASATQSNTSPAATEVDRKSEYETTTVFGTRDEIKSKLFKINEQYSQSEKGCTIAFAAPADWIDRKDVKSSPAGGVKAGFIDAEAVDDNLKTAQGALVAVFTGKDLTNDWTTADEVLLLPAPSSDDSSQATIYIKKPIVEWKGDNLVVTESGKELIEKLKDQNGKPLQFQVSIPSALASNLDSTRTLTKDAAPVSFSDKKPALSKENEDLETKISFYDPEQISRKYEECYKGNQFLDIGSALINELGASLPDDERKTFTESLKPLSLEKFQTFLDEKGDISKKPEKGIDLPKYLSTVFSTLEKEYLKRRVSLSSEAVEFNEFVYSTEFSKKQDIAKSIITIRDRLAKTAQRLNQKAAKSKDIERELAYVRGIQKVWQIAAPDTEKCSQMMILADASNPTPQTKKTIAGWQAKIQSNTSKIEKMSSLTTKDFSVFTKIGDRQINFIVQ